MFYLDPRNVYRVRALDRLGWLDHGFGTRLSGNWVPGPLAWVKQIHSDRIVVANGATGLLGEADSLIASTPGRYVGVRTADCIPILIADERVKAVGAVHAGWRGTAETIAAKAVVAMRKNFGSRPEDLIAAIGPGICGACYEVGPEVAERFVAWLPPGKTLDLAEANRRQLIEAGVPGGRVITGAPCTACHPSEFYSWRRDRERTGRMVSAAAVLG